jgi:hypothetical protein
MNKPDDKHGDYTEYASVWKTCRDASTGQRAIHSNGTRYLPKLAGQSDEEYSAYKARAVYFNATGRTVEAMRGLVFRKTPTVTVPKTMEPWLEDITLSGITMGGLARKTLEDVLKVGRHGLLVDYPPPPNTETPLTISQAQAQNMRPFISPYTAETILNWRNDRVGSKTMLVQVFLYETVKYEPDYSEQIRELSLMDGFYQQIIWRKDKNKNEWFEYERIVPTVNGDALNLIPFWFVGPEETDGSVCNPPIEDLAYINISHYMNSADIENGAHVSGLPTPYITGLDEKTSVNLGTGTVLIVPNENAKVGFLQVETGFETLEKLMDRKEQQMAAIGARLIAPEKKAAEAAETAGIRRSGENSVLADIAGAVEMPIRQALQFMAEWAGISGEVTFEFNKDFLPMQMDAQMLTALVAAWQSGAISEHTFFENMQAGEIIMESVTFDDEVDRKAESTPPLGMVDPNANNQ